MSIEVITQDLLDIPQRIIDRELESGIVAHQVNCQGVMGAGVALQVKKRFPKAYEAYRGLCDKSDPADLLGKAQVVFVGGGSMHSAYIANVFGQLGYGKGLQTDYQAVKTAMRELEATFEDSFHSPPTLYVPYMMGCALGGGDWDTYSAILESYPYGVVACKLPEAN